MTRGGPLTIIASCIVVAFCVVPTAAEFHGLFEYGSFEDYTAGHEYVPQLSSFEAALLKIRNREEHSAKHLEDVTGKRFEHFLPEVDDISLATDHPHKRPVELAVKPSSRPAISRNRRLETVEYPRGGGRLSQRSEMENEIRRRTIGLTILPAGLGGSTMKALSVVTNGLNSPELTTAPSTAAIGSDYFRFGSVTPAPSVNWTMTQVSTFVHFEGAFCQSCWAIAVADAVSLMRLINLGKGSLLSGPGLLPTDISYGAPEGNGGADMSPQQICDCMGVSCCNGGWPESALQYVQLNGGLSSWTNYPYTANPNATQCDAQKSSSLSAKVTGFESVPAGNIDAFKQAVSMLPVIAFISSSSPDFGGYTGGIYNGNCSGTIDHVVLITGYGADPVGGPYWIIKNSWGPYWGEQGYMRIAMTPGNGMCGITGSNGLYPVYFPPGLDSCKAFPNPCGSGTCALQPVLGLGGVAFQARCTCPTGFAENFGFPPKCVPANPCAANPNPCGGGTCSPLKDGSYSCACPPNTVVGSAANGNPRCVASGSQSYVVQATDTCSTISAAYGITTGALKQQNVWLDCSASLAAGTVLVIGKTAVPAGSITYVTQTSDTCTNVASQYGITLVLLQQYNPAVDCSNLQLGTNLALPSVSGNKLPPATSPTCAKVYSVTVGDTCASISATVGVNLTTLTKLNRDIDCTKLLTPPTTVCTAAAAKGANSSTSTCLKYYAVKHGDSCPSIWNYANLTMAQFFSANPGLRCDSPHLRVGELVCIAAPNLTLAIPQGVTYVVQAGDTLSSISSLWSMRCGAFASKTSIAAANPAVFNGTATPAPGVQLVIPCPTVGSSDACGCGSSGPAVCGNDYAWYSNTCSSRCNGGGAGFPSCTGCAQACHGRVTLTPPGGTPFGCTANNGGVCLPQWDGSCKKWLSGCQNQCYQAQWSGTNQNNNYRNCLPRCRGNC